MAEGNDENGKLAQVRTKGSYSVVSLPHQWFILVMSSELKREPIGRRWYPRVRARG